jgi:hypothetical protein
MNMQLRGSICVYIERERREGTQQCQVKLSAYNRGHPDNSILLFAPSRNVAEELGKAVLAIGGDTGSLTTVRR